MFGQNRVTNISNDYSAYAPIFQWNLDFKEVGYNEQKEVIVNSILIF